MLCGDSSTDAVLKLPPQEGTKRSVADHEQLRTYPLHVLFESWVLSVLENTLRALPVETLQALRCASRKCVLHVLFDWERLEGHKKKELERAQERVLLRMQEKDCSGFKNMLAFLDRSVLMALPQKSLQTALLRMHTEDSSGFKQMVASLDHSVLFALPKKALKTGLLCMQEEDSSGLEEMLATLDHWQKLDLCSALGGGRRNESVRKLKCTVAKLAGDGFMETVFDRYSVEQFDQALHVFHRWAKFGQSERYVLEAFCPRVRQYLDYLVWDPTTGVYIMLVILLGIGYQLGIAIAFSVFARIAITGEPVHDTITGERVHITGERPAVMIIALASLSVLQEFCQAFGAFRKDMLLWHVTNFWNWMSVMTALAVIFSTSAALYKPHTAQSHWLTAIMAITSCMNCVMILESMRAIHRHFASLILAFTMSLAHIRYLVVLMAVLGYAFHEAFSILLWRYEPEVDDGPNPYRRRGDGIYEVMLLVLGEFDFDLYRESRTSELAFCAFMLVMAVIALNLLIAVVSDAYDKSKAKEDILFCVRRYQFCTEVYIMKSNPFVRCVARTGVIGLSGMISLYRKAAVCRCPCPPIDSYVSENGKKRILWVRWKLLAIWKFLFENGKEGILWMRWKLLCAFAIGELPDHLDEERPGAEWSGRVNEINAMTCQVEKKLARALDALAEDHSGKLMQLGETLQHPEQKLDHMLQLQSTGADARNGHGSWHRAPGFQPSDAASAGRATEDDAKARELGEAETAAHACGGRSRARGSRGEGIRFHHAHAILLEESLSLPPALLPSRRPRTLP